MDALYREPLRQIITGIRESELRIVDALAKRKGISRSELVRRALKMIIRADREGKDILQ